MADLNEHVFNGDLLANPDDRDTAQKLYPTVVHVLYHAELIEYFSKYNDRADAAKRTSRAWGKWAIALGGLAIALAAIEIIVETSVKDILALVVGAVAGICGVSSVAIGALGMLYGARKREWLQNRFMGERIRQFHFQGVVAQIPEIIAFLEPNEAKKAEAKAAFEASRKKSLLELKTEYEGNLDGQFTSVLGPDGEKNWWLHEGRQPIAPAEGKASLAPLFAAYRHLRIKHQLGFANYKLQSDHKLFSDMPVRQAEILDSITKAGIAWLLLIHAAVLVIVLFAFASFVTGVRGDSHLPEAAGWISVVFSVAIIVIAVGALCARAFEQGLQPEREIERYQQYRSTVQSILEQFDSAETPADKIQIMRQMERAAFDEMRNFLRTYDRSSFAF